MVLFTAYDTCADVNRHFRRVPYAFPAFFIDASTSATYVQFRETTLPRYMNCSTTGIKIPSPRSMFERSVLSYVAGR